MYNFSIMLYKGKNRESYSWLEITDYMIENRTHNKWKISSQTEHIGIRNQENRPACWIQQKTKELPNSPVYGREGTGLRIDKRRESIRWKKIPHPHLNQDQSTMTSTTMFIHSSNPAGMVHSTSGLTWGMQVKLWDPLRTRAMPEHLRGVFTTRSYTNPSLPWQMIQHNTEQHDERK